MYNPYFQVPNIPIDTFDHLCNLLNHGWRYPQLAHLITFEISHGQFQTLTNRGLIRVEDLRVMGAPQPPPTAATPRNRNHARPSSAPSAIGRGFGSHHDPVGGADGSGNSRWVTLNTDRRVFNHPGLDAANPAQIVIDLNKVTAPRLNSRAGTPPRFLDDHPYMPQLQSREHPPSSVQAIIRNWYRREPVVDGKAVLQGCDKDRTAFKGALVSALKSCRMHGWKERCQAVQELTYVWMCENKDYLFLDDSEINRFIGQIPLKLIDAIEKRNTDLFNECSDIDGLPWHKPPPRGDGGNSSGGSGSRFLA